MFFTLFSLSLAAIPGYKFALVTAAGLIGFLAFLGVVRCLRSSSAESGVIATATGRAAAAAAAGGGGGSHHSNAGNSGSSSRGIRSAGLALSTSLLPTEEDRTPLNAGSPYSVPVSIFNAFALLPLLKCRQVVLIRNRRRALDKGIPTTESVSQPVSQSLL